jgi:predicted nucleotide-binding protein (sugar kinase/HSP70/actin superfamily)
MDKEKEKKLNKSRFAQREHSVKTKDRVVAWPRMGNIDLSMGALVSSLGAKIVMPPQNTNKALEIGVKNSIEGICLPYKLNLANYIMALENGANTLMMFQAPGSCRFGNYTKMAQKTLKKMGYKFDMIVFDMYQSKMKQTLEAFWHVTRCINPYRYYKGFSTGFNKAFAIDTAERLLFYTRPREINKGEAERCYKKWYEIIRNTTSVRDCKKLKKQVIEDFKKIPVDKDKIVPKVYLLGEFFVLLDPFTNQEIEKTLGDLGVEVQRQIFFSDWLEHVLQPSIFYKKESHRERCVRYAKDYMKRAIGGECLETVGDTVYAAKNNIDGIIHIMPFSCMPEIVAQNILPKDSKNENIPILELVLDEQTGKAGNITRIEAFVDLVMRKKLRRENDKVQK